MSKTNKLILIFSIIGVIGIGAIIAMLIIMNNNTEEEEDEETHVSQSETLFIDEVINFGKAAETKYVADSLSSSNPLESVVCYNISDLSGTYVTSDDNYSGKVVLTISNDTITKAVTMTNKKYYVVDAIPSLDMDVHTYTYSRWDEIDSECE